jgi:ATP-binding cassette subfamily F protein uup
MAAVPQQAVAPSSPSPARAAGSGSTARPRRRSFKENRELAELERSLPAWEARRAELEAQLARGGTAAGDYTALERLSADLSELVVRIEQGEERWLELSELAG